jgi:hypothetical protein
MFYVLFLKGEVVAVTAESPYTGTPALKKFDGIEYDAAQSRWDWESLEEVENLAAKLTEITGKLHMGEDSGPNVSPRFDIFCPPAVGDKVSYAFNGDYHPDGEIVRITPSWMVITSTGSKYNRKKNSGTWKKVGGTWSLVSGHISRQNPEV